MAAHGAAGDGAGVPAEARRSSVGTWDPGAAGRDRPRHRRPDRLRAARAGGTGVRRPPGPVRVLVRARPRPSVMATGARTLSRSSRWTAARPAPGPGRTGSATRHRRTWPPTRTCSRPSARPSRPPTRGSRGSSRSSAGACCRGSGPAPPASSPDAEAPAPRHPHQLRRPHRGAVPGLKAAPGMKEVAGGHAAGHPECGRPTGIRRWWCRGSRASRPPGSPRRCRPAPPPPVRSPPRAVRPASARGPRSR